jgi:RecA/RadA recombinase
MKNKDIKNQLRPKPLPPITAKDYLSTGSTLLNLAISGKPGWGFLKGKYYWLVGDSVSGKTWFSLTCLAEASINSNFDNYRFIYDNNEGGALMDMQRFFGKRVAERLEAPAMDKDLPCYSSTIEEFFYHIDDALKSKQPFIYILDSMDSLSSDSEIDKFKQQKKARGTDRVVAGSYGDGKAKKNSSMLRQLLSPLAKSGSILIVISQTRSNIGFGAQFNPKTYSGGHALKFYATVEIWSSVIKPITKKIQGKNRQLGSLIKLKTKRTGSLAGSVQ